MDDDEETGDAFRIPDLWKASALTYWGQEGKSLFVEGLDAIGRTSTKIMKEVAGHLLKLLE